MSYWDYSQGIVVTILPQPFPGYPAWLLIDCGCCGGILWSNGTEPVECSTCQGTGFIAKHEESGMLAVYPGGPARGFDGEIHGA